MHLLCHEFATGKHAGPAHPCTALVRGWILPLQDWAILILAAEIGAQSGAWICDGSLPSFNLTAYSRALAKLLFGSRLAWIHVLSTIWPDAWRP